MDNDLIEQEILEPVFFELPDIRLSVMEAVYFDTVVHAMGKHFCLDDAWKESVMREANFAGRQYCTSQDVRDIYRCMDLGLSTVECTKFLWERHRQELLKEIEHAS